MKKKKKSFLFKKSIIGIIFDLGLSKNMYTLNFTLLLT